MHPRNEKRSHSHGMLAEVLPYLKNGTLQKPAPPSPSKPAPSNYSPPNGWWRNVCIRAKWSSARKKVVERMARRHCKNAIELSRRKKVLNIPFRDSMKEEFHLLFEKQKMYRRTQESWYDGRQGILYVLTGSTLHLTTDTGC